MPRGHHHHQRIVPNSVGDDSIIDFTRARKPNVIQVLVEPLDLLGQRDLEQAYCDLGFLLAARCEKGRETWWDTVRNGNPQLAVEAARGGFHAVARLLQSGEDA